MNWHKTEEELPEFGFPVLVCWTKLTGSLMINPGSGFGKLVVTKYQAAYPSNQYKCFDEFRYSNHWQCEYCNANPPNYWTYVEHPETKKRIGA